MFDDPIFSLKEDLYNRPSKSLIYSARWIMATITNRSLIPDWVEALANGNPERWDAVIEVAREDIRAEAAMPPAGAQKGQSLVETAIGLALILILFVVGWNWLMTNPVVQKMKDDTSEALTHLSATIDMSQSHAELKHGGAAIAADQCFQQNGVYETWTNPTTRLSANICHIPDGTWFIQILNDQMQEITKFAKDKMRNYDQVAQYLRNSGYIPPQ